MEFNFDKLIGRIIEKFKTRGLFAEKVGISESVLSYRLNNKTYFTPEEIYIISKPDCLDIPPEEIGLYFFTPKVR